MRTLTSKQAKAIDTRAIQEWGISTLMLMENAGIRIAEFVLGVLRKKRNRRVAVFCGKGNNAGDGLVVGRQLICEGIYVDVFLLTPEYSLSLSARNNLKILKKITKNIRRIKTGKDAESIDLACYGLLIDAIFGIGLKGRVEGIFKTIIHKINSSGKTTVSIDIPSGLDANKGRILGVAVKADYTLTLIAAKRGFLIKQGPECVGKIIVRHIGFPL